MISSPFLCGVVLRLATTRRYCWIVLGRRLSASICLVITAIASSQVGHDEGVFGANVSRIRTTAASAARFLFGSLVESSFRLPSGPRKLAR
jgi:hypothetical protein